MFRIPSISGLFKWRQFEPEVILLPVGWYLRFSLSYRDVEELLAERGLLVDHVTVWRWVQRYARSIDARVVWRPELRRQFVEVFARVLACARGNLGGEQVHDCSRPRAHVREAVACGCLD